MHGHGYLNALQRAKSAVYGPHGEKIGTLGRIFMDVGTGDPDFAAVSLGLFGSEECIVSLDGAEIFRGHLHVAFTKDVVRHAPHLDTDVGLAEADKELLDRYYAHNACGP